MSLPEPYFEVVTVHPSIIGVTLRAYETQVMDIVIFWLMFVPAKEYVVSLRAFSDSAPLAPGSPGKSKLVDTYQISIQTNPNQNIQFHALSWNKRQLPNPHHSRERVIFIRFYSQAVSKLILAPPEGHTLTAADFRSVRHTWHWPPGSRVI